MRLEHSNYCPPIGGISQPAHDLMNRHSRLPLWSRTGCIGGKLRHISDNVWCHYFQHQFCICRAYLLLFLTNRVERTGLSSVRRWTICVKLELSPFPSPHPLCPCLARKRMLNDSSIGTFLLLAHTCQPREKFSRDKRRPVERSEAGFGRGVRGSSPGNFQKPVLQMVQSELFLSYICQYN